MVKLGASGLSLLTTSFFVGIVAVVADSGVDVVSCCCCCCGAVAAACAAAAAAAACAAAT